MNEIVQKKKSFNWKLWLVLFVIALIAGYYISGLFTITDLTIGNADDKLLYIITHPFHIWWNSKTIPAMLISAMLWLLGLTYSLSNLKNYMPGKEMGSAEWGEPESFNKRLQDPDAKGDNMVLSLNLKKSYNTKYTLLNNNMVVIGGSGSGKTAGFVAPNLLQFHGSNVYTDPKGDTLADFGPILQMQGIRVKVIDLNNMRNSMRYNPFKYIRVPGDITKLITNLLANTTPADANKGDPFWDKAESLYLQGLFGYVWYECDNIPYYRFIQINKPSGKQEKIAKNELAGCIDIVRIDDNVWRGLVTDANGNAVKLNKTFRTFLRLLDEAAVSDDESVMSPLDCRMKVLEADIIERGGDPKDHPALKNYYRAIRGAGDTVRSIIISANSRFAPFDNEELLNILDGDDIDLPSLGIGIDGDKKTKTALFCVLPDDDTTWNFVPGMLYTQMFQELYRVARLYGNKLPIDVGFWFDEFANIKMPNDFEKILSTCRSRNIYITIILQSLAQIKGLYKDTWEGVVGNCDTRIYLGGNESSSHKYFSELLGKWTIDKRTTGETLGSHGSSSRNYDILGRELMTTDEIAKMPNEDLLVFVRGENPIYDKKMYWFKQEKWKYINDMWDYKPQEGVYEEIFALNNTQLEYIQSDTSKEVMLWELNSWNDFLNIDFGEAETLTAMDISNQIEKIRSGEIVIEKYNLEEESEKSLLDLMIDANLNEEQTKALTNALNDDMPEDMIKDLIKIKAAPERIELVVAMYKRGLN